MNTNTTEIKKVTDVITAITLLFAFLNYWEKKLFTELAYWSTEGSSIIVGVFTYTIRTAKFLGCKALEGIMILFTLEMLLIASIMFAQSSDTPLAWAYLETLNVIFQAIMQELAVLLRYLIYIQLQ